MKSYSEKLKDPRWQKKRLQILERDQWKCQRCSETKSFLHVHHKRYVKGREPWEYPDADLTSLCEDCHEDIYVLRQGINEMMSDDRQNGILEIIHQLVTNPEINDWHVYNLLYCLREMPDLIPKVEQLVYEEYSERAAKDRIAKIDAATHVPL